MLKLIKCCKALSFVSCLVVASTVLAQDMTKPPSIEEIKGIRVSNKKNEGDFDTPAMRIEAMKEAALSYGARSGMIYRNWEIFNLLKKQEMVLDGIFDFSKLLIPGPYGTLIEPPIISESENAFLLGEQGMAASMTSKIYSIGENSKIVTASRNWREYLLDHLDLKAAEEPDDILRPKDKGERMKWIEYVEEGWINGVDQANDILAENIDVLLSDFIGMVRYRKLLAQKMVSAPYAVKEYRGVTGNANEIRIDDKAVIITNVPALNKSVDKWEPTER